MTIQIRRDTAANFTSGDPTLSSGEPALETDTGRWKFGDGSTAWTSLEYVGAVTPTNTQTGASYTLVLADMGQRIKMNSGSAQTLTIPQNSSVAFPVGTTIIAQQFGAGALTIEGLSGAVTLNGVSGGSGAVSSQYGMVTLFKDATDVWTASGAIGAVA